MSRLPLPLGTLLTQGVAVLAFALSCGGSKSSDDDDSGGETNATVCTPGSTMRCSGKDSCPGAQVCRSDGSGYSACDCGETGAGGAKPASGGGGGAAGATPAAGGSSGRGGSTAAGTGGGASGATGGSEAGKSAGGSGGSDSTGGTAGSDAREYKLCLKACTSESDCGTGTPGDGPANYACVDGACHPIGCQSDADCAAVTPAALCRALPGAPYKTCNRACSDASACGAATSMLYRPENYECTDGICEYLGCSADEECQVDLAQPDSRCVDTSPIPSCASPCEVPADCTVAGAATLQDEDNYACERGSCVWLGCLSDSECAYLPGYVCQPYS